jgi:lysophospholipase L1-like esterase
VYLRFAALGDSVTVGVGDPVPGGWRGWSRLLAESLGTSYDVSYCNTAVSGSTVGSVLRDQLADAVDHRPDVASLVVGLNDTMRSSFDPVLLREDLMSCAEALSGAGALLLTARFHDMGAVFGLPGVLRRPLLNRVLAVNAAYDEVHARFGGLRLDLTVHPAARDRAYWSVDRLHPSERGHRALAVAFAELMLRHGFDFDLPSLEPTGPPTRWHEEMAWMVQQGAPWFGRRAKDLGPWAVRLALAGR